MAKIEWSTLGFSYIPTNSHIEYHYSNGKWDGGELKKEPFLKLSIAAGCLHYGQECFEGLKAYMCKDGEIRIFRPDENSKRMNSTARYTCMPEVPTEIFIDAIRRVVKDNIEFVPPYGTGGSMYIRPLLIGSGPVIGVAPAETYTFVVFVMPVGPYYKGGITPVDTIIFEDYDRAAPNGSGCYKVGGNYAAGMQSAKIAKKQGFPVVLFLDSKEHLYFDEFTTSNFIVVTKDGKYITPESKSILPSVTNKSLLQIAQDLGIKVERRPIRFDEIENFAEVGACGTAVVITPIRKIVRGDKVYNFGETCGPVMKRLYDELTDIQYGRKADTHGWLFPL